jgi:hypothetical protein
MTNGHLKAALQSAKTSGAVCGLSFNFHRNQIGSKMLSVEKLDIIIVSFGC